MGGFAELYGFGQVGSEGYGGSVFGEAVLCKEDTGGLEGAVLGEGGCSGDGVEKLEGGC